MSKTIIVISGGISPNGRLPFFVKERLDEAYKQFIAGIGKRIILPGKWSYRLETPPPKTEAKAMKEYLEKLGVDKKHLFLEEKSHDLLTSVYNIKKLYLKPRNYKNLLIVASDYQKERVEYIFRKVLGREYNVNFRFVPCRLPAETMWEFFIYEQKTLTRTKTLFKLLKEKNISLSSAKLLETPFYRKKVPGLVRDLVFQRKTAKPRTSKRHYSIAKIYKKRIEIFTKYKLDVQKVKTLKADFWSGRFLNFSGRSEYGTHYSLKFLLYQKDKKTFSREIKLIEYLDKKGVDFVPKIVEDNIDKSPAWYLYKVISGRISGLFSITYSFEDYFYKDFVIKNLVKNLKKFRSIGSDDLEIPQWYKKTYQKRFSSLSNRLISIGELSQSKTIKKSQDLFLKNLSLFDKVSNKHLSHNDLHPANIIINLKERKVFLIDFEHVAYNNVAFDFCFAYLFSWKNKAFREKLLSEFLSSLNEKEKSDFNMIFDLVYIYFLFWFISFVYTWKKRAGEENFKKAKSFAFGELKRINSTSHTARG